MDLTGKKQISRLQEELAKLKSEFTELQQNTEKEKKDLLAYNKNVSEDVFSLQKQLQDLQTNSQQAFTDKSTLQRQINDLNYKLSMKTQEMKQLHDELGRIKQKEEQVSAAANKLLIAEERLASLVNKSKLMTADLIKGLKRFMDRFEHLKEGNRGYEAKGAKFYMPDDKFGTDAQNLELEKRGKQLAYPLQRSDVMSAFPDSLINLYLVYDRIDKLGMLIMKEERISRLVLESDTFVKKLVKREYKNTLQDIRGTTEFSSYLIRNLENNTLQEAQIEEINQIIMEHVRGIITLLTRCKEHIDNGYIGAMFQGYDNYQKGLQKKLNKLFRLFVDEINKNEDLVNRLVDLQNKEILDAEQAFGAYLMDKTRRSEARIKSRKK